MLPGMLGSRRRSVVIATLCALAGSLTAVSACGADDREPRGDGPAAVTGTNGDGAAANGRAADGNDGGRGERAAQAPTRDAGAAPGAEHFKLTQAANGVSAPVWVGAAPGDRRGLWVAQQNGRLLRIAGGKKTVRLSVASQTTASGERGLLGVAFLPDYAKSKRLVIHYTNRSGDTRVELWRMGKRATRMATLLRVKQPYANHNGGPLVFGDRNRLYFGLGDGGGGNDPDRTAQNPNSRLGKILVATVNRNSKRPSWKIAAYGLRNPWRMWFDRQAKELWIADVGQNAVEEISRIPAIGKAPNLGWSTYEGRRRNGAGAGRLSGTGNVIWPVLQYDHDHGCSVTGGEIYRGNKIGPLRGRYVFGDFCSGAIWSARPTSNGGVEDVRKETAELPQLTSFGAGPDGELYATALSGSVMRLSAK